MADDGPLLGVLHESARLGFLGPGAVAPGVDHARRLGAVLRPAHRLLDLGSGGGLPGLVLAWDRPDLEVVLLDGRQRRTDFLERAIGRLGLRDHCRVLAGRAEVLAQQPTWRHRFDAVVARAFGAPAVVLEAAAPFVRVGGQVVVSEPPGGRSSWPLDVAAAVGLEPDPPTVGFQSFTAVRPCPAPPRR